MWDQGETVKSSLGAGSWNPINRYTQQYLWAILQILKLPPGGRSWWLTVACCPRACRPQTSWNWKLMMLTLTYLTTSSSEEMAMDWSFPLRTITIKLLPSPSEDTRFWGHWTCCVSPFDCKAAKLSFSTSPKTVSEIWFSIGVQRSWAFGIKSKRSSKEEWLLHPAVQVHTPHRADCLEWLPSIKLPNWGKLLILWIS